MYDNNVGHTFLSIDPCQLAQLNNKYVSLYRQYFNQILEKKKKLCLLLVKFKLFSQATAL
jgi:hypothetical protein